ncbi:methyl-accepting chemotaxis protein [Tissierella creatinophila]|uniref:Methyl-accepting chemotaxis protein McpA n=1 Tax=Tissierella creatinophila DSM 6911 TaxID=1123403 RepID=A0A1U7M3Y5_TISCR|nr:methyl-accepting chemotaxis protein [Tissierella creatinophila]OLS01908.1 methyl-accepting chemotaxis protein McpA [Tissierella creatinophila DSM 6911]
MKLTVRKKLLLGFSSLIILIAILSGFSIYNLAKINDDVNTLYNMHLKGIEYIKDTQVNLISLGRARNNMILSTTDAEEVRHADNMKLLFEQFEQSLEDFNKTIVVDEAREKFDEISILWEELKPNEEKIIDIVSRGDDTQAYTQAINNRIISDKIEVEIEALVNLKDKQALQAYNNVDKVFARTTKSSILLLFLSILGGIGIAFSLSRVIAIPIAQMSNTAKRIADGDLSVKPLLIKNNDEIGELATSFNTMTEGLRSVISNVLDASQQVAASSQELSASSEETTAATEEVASTINQLAIGASKQAMDSTEASRIVGEMALSIQNVAENANSVSISSQNVSEKSTSGLNESKKAMEKIERIKRVTEESADVVRVLGNESIKIGEIVEVIQGIADQTNLLALNAAIEAARAGEDGRGFAVVAEEIRKLAEQSSVSALEISELISRIQSETKSIVDVMDVSTQEVLEGVKAVNETGKYFGMIFNDINDITSEVQQVSAEVQEIVSGSQSVNEAMESIASIAEETAASSEEVSAASEEQAAAMVQVSNSSQDLAKLAEELQLNVSTFRL